MQGTKDISAVYGVTWRTCTYLLTSIYFLARIHASNNASSSKLHKFLTEPAHTTCREKRMIGWTCACTCAVRWNKKPKFSKISPSHQCKTCLIPRREARKCHCSHQKYGCMCWIPFRLQTIQPYRLRNSKFFFLDLTRPTGSIMPDLEYSEKQIRSCPSCPELSSTVT